MRRLFSAFAVTALSLSSCSDYGAVTYGTPPNGTYAGPGAGVGVGQTCDESTPCRRGLACSQGKCSPAHSSDPGAPCAISQECHVGLYCSPLRTCAPAGTGGDGVTCKSDGDCQSGFRCAISGLSLRCRAEGTVDVGGDCQTATECYGGLACASKKCTPLPAGSPPPIAYSTWKGADCKDESGDTLSYFRVPRGSGDGDFYRLPFPNNVRLKAGRPDLSGHPTPGAELLGFDAVDRYLRDVETNTNGFSTYTSMYFRFSAAPDFDSMKLDGAIRVIDITSPTQPQAIGFGWQSTTATSPYLCANTLRIRPFSGQPLGAGRTYAAILSTSIVDANKKAIRKADDFSAMLAAQAPTDPALTAAYAAYKPLREWSASSSGIPAASILNASVFTVGKATELLPKLASAVERAPAASATNWVKCGTSPSPCPQATGDRACGASSAAFDELHALVTLPIFQKGTPPYVEPSAGGDIAIDASGEPLLQRSEAVCMSLTIPKGAAMPTGGWPLIVYAHGTGGSFRSHVLEGVAERLALIDDGTTQVRAAVLGIDQVQHGPRRGNSNASPDDLFYNFANPAASRGNPLQGAVDQMSLARFAKALDLSASASPTASAIKVGSIAFWGHSQGATEGGIALSYVPSVLGAVLSGEGASLIDALLTKKSPVPISDALPFVLVDPAVDGTHPALTMLQNSIDVADPLNHARTLSIAPIKTNEAKHIFQPFGLGDTYSPPATQKVFALAAGLGIVTPPAGTTPDAISSAQPIAVPASSNLTVGGRPITAVVRQYAPNAYDGHFVAFRDATAKRDVDFFLADVLRPSVPRVGR